MNLVTEKPIMNDNLPSRKLDTVIENLTICSVYEDGFLRFHMDKENNLLKRAEVPRYHSYLRPYKYTFRATFEVERITYSGEIHLKHDGKWEFSNKRYGIYQKEQNGKKLNVDRTGTLFLRRMFILKAQECMLNLNQK